MVIAGDMSVQALQYLLNCRGECEHLDFKEVLQMDNDYGCSTVSRDIVAMKNSGGGYIIIGVKDGTWDPIGINEYITLDTKKLRDGIRKATGLELDADIVRHKLFLYGEYREFALILIRSTKKISKLRTPSVCRNSFHPKDDWGIRNGEIYFRKGDSTVRVSSQQELEVLIYNLIEREDQSEQEQEDIDPSPFQVETGLYRLLSREYERFIGRTDLLRTAQEAIEKDPRIWIVNLYGPGGVGKSALATWLAYYYYEKDYFEAILQLSAKETQLTSSGITKLNPSLYSLENLLSNILLLFNFNDYINESMEIQKETCITLLSDYAVLLILDNMETIHDGRILEFVRSLPPTNNKGLITKTKVLITSRMRTSGWEMPIAVEELNYEEVKEFLRIKVNEMNIGPLKDFDVVAKKIHEASGGLPLAIQWILGLYAITGDIMPVISRVRDSDSPLLEFSFRSSWNVLSQDSQTALAVLSIFDSAPILRDWSTALDWPTERTERAAEQLVLATFVSKQVDHKTGQETYNTLPITLTFAANELTKMGDLDRISRTRYQRYVQEMDLVATETERFTSIFEEFSIERYTEKKAVILARKAESYKTRLNYDEAEKLYQEALAIDPRSVYVLVNYGSLKLEMGQIGESIRLLETASKICNKASGFLVYYNLSKVYDVVWDRDQVERCLRKALEYQPDHTTAKQQLGVVLSRLGRYNESIDLFDEIIDKELAKGSTPSNRLIYAYKSKIITLRKAGRNNDALAVLTNGLEQIKRWSHLAGRAPQLKEALEL
jgi:tetratricopeptide (TPR) repeat protein